MTTDTKPPEDLGDLSTEERQEFYLEALTAGSNFREAAIAAGVHPRTGWVWRNNPEFAAKCKEARKVSVTNLVEEAERRAMNGSDKLLMFLLSAYDPARFRQAPQRLELTGADGGPVEMTDTQAAARVAALLDLARVRKSAQAGTLALDDLL